MSAYVRQLKEEASNAPTVLRPFTPPVLGYPKDVLDAAMLAILPAAPDESPVARDLAPRGLTISAVVADGWNGTRWSRLDVHVWKSGRTVTSSDRAAVEDAVKSVTHVSFTVRVAAPAQPL